MLRCFPIMGRQPKKKAKKPTRLIQTRIPVPLFNDLRVLIDRERRTNSNYLQMLIEEHVTAMKSIRVKTHKAIQRSWKGAKGRDVLREDAP